MTTPSSSTPVVRSSFNPSTSTSPQAAPRAFVPLSLVEATLLSAHPRTNTLGFTEPLPKQPSPLPKEIIYHSHPTRLDRHGKAVPVFANKPNRHVCLTPETLLTLGKWMDPQQFNIKEGTEQEPTKLVLDCVDITNQQPTPKTIDFKTSFAFQVFLTPSFSDLVSVGKIEQGSEQSKIKRLFSLIRKKTEVDLPFTALTGQTFYAGIGLDSFLNRDNSIKISQAVFAFLRELKANAVKSKQPLINILLLHVTSVSGVAKIIADYMTESQLEALTIPEEPITVVQPAPKTGLLSCFPCFS
jgi:hypothetical protein